MRCGCKSRGNANLYLCVLVPERQFPCFTFLLLAFHIAYIVALLLLGCCCSRLSVLFFAHFKSMDFKYKTTAHKALAAMTATTVDRRNKTMYLFVAFLCKIPRPYSRQKQFFRKTEAENIQANRQHKRKKKTRTHSIAHPNEYLDRQKERERKRTEWSALCRN